MRKTRTDVSLCIRCARAAGCTIPQESGEPILSCVWFESIEQSSSGYAEDMGNVREGSASQVEGLCGDCGNRESCVFRRREGGTWHCEEYC